jgi:DNA-binding NarL/FixJ family response regulator
MRLAQVLHRQIPICSGTRGNCPGTVTANLADWLLTDLKSHEDLRSVVVPTTSQAEEDIARGHALHANAYVSKPADYHRLGEAVQQINDFS